MISLDVSIGEAIDKLSILMIKQEFIHNIDKLKHINHEIDCIYPKIKEIINNHKHHYQWLLWINKEIWKLSDDVRNPDITLDVKNTLFLQTFLLNDGRFRIKNKFNLLSSSMIKEQKSYPTHVYMINPLEDAEDYIANDCYIRYLTLCYDLVVLMMYQDVCKHLEGWFEDDPLIMIKVFDHGVYNNLDWSHQPLSNVFNRLPLGKCVVDVPIQ